MPSQLINDFPKNDSNVPVFDPFPYSCKFSQSDQLFILNKMSEFGTTADMDKEGQHLQHPMPRTGGYDNITGTTPAQGKALWELQQSVWSHQLNGQGGGDSAGGPPAPGSPGSAHEYQQALLSLRRELEEKNRTEAQLRQLVHALKQGPTGSTPYVYADGCLPLSDDMSPAPSSCDGVVESVKDGHIKRLSRELTRLKHKVHESEGWEDRLQAALQDRQAAVQRCLNLETLLASSDRRVSELEQRAAELTSALTDTRSQLHHQTALSAGEIERGREMLVMQQAEVKTLKESVQRLSRENQLLKDQAAAGNSGNNVSPAGSLSNGAAACCSQELESLHRMVDTLKTTVLEQQEKLRSLRFQKSQLSLRAQSFPLSARHGALTSVHVAKNTPIPLGGTLPTLGDARRTNAPTAASVATNGGMQEDANSLEDKDIDTEKPGASLNNTQSSKDVIKAMLPQPLSSLQVGSAEVNIGAKDIVTDFVGPPTGVKSHSEILSPIVSKDHPAVSTTRPTSKSEEIRGRPSPQLQQQDQNQQRPFSSPLNPPQRSSPATAQDMMNILGLRPPPPPPPSSKNNEATGRAEPHSGNTMVRSPLVAPHPNTDGMLRPELPPPRVPLRTDEGHRSSRSAPQRPVPPPPTILPSSSSSSHQLRGPEPPPLPYNTTLSPQYKYEADILKPEPLTTYRLAQSRDSGQGGYSGLASSAMMVDPTRAVSSVSSPGSVSGYQTASTAVSSSSHNLPGDRLQVVNQGIMGGGSVLLNQQDQLYQNVDLTPPLLPPQPTSSVRLPNQQQQYNLRHAPPPQQTTSTDPYHITYGGTQQQQHSAVTTTNAYQAAPHTTQSQCMAATQPDHSHTNNTSSDRLEQRHNSDRTCPVCGRDFGLVAMSDFQSHVFQCFDEAEPETLRPDGGTAATCRECPVCAQRFEPSTPQEEFERHVHSHFGEEEFDILQP